MPEANFSVSEKLKSLIGAKDVLVKISYANNEYVEIGVAQGVGINIGQTVDRLITLGSKATLPFAGYYMAQISFRKFFMQKDKMTQTIDLQSSALPNPLTNIQMILTPVGDEAKPLVLEISKAYWNAHSISVQAGQVLVFEDLMFECEDISFQSTK